MVPRPLRDPTPSRGATCAMKGNPLRYGILGDIHGNVEEWCINVRDADTRNRFVRGGAGCVCRRC